MHGSSLSMTEAGRGWGALVMRYAPRFPKNGQLRFAILIYGLSGKLLFKYIC